MLKSVYKMIIEIKLKVKNVWIWLEIDNGIHISNKISSLSTSLQTHTAHRTLNNIHQSFVYRHYYIKYKCDKFNFSVVAICDSIVYRLLQIFSASIFVSILFLGVERSFYLERIFGRGKTLIRKKKSVGVDWMNRNFHN